MVSTQTIFHYKTQYSTQLIINISTEIHPSSAKHTIQRSAHQENFASALNLSTSADFSNTTCDKKKKKRQKKVSPLVRHQIGSTVRWNLRSLTLRDLLGHNKEAVKTFCWAGTVGHVYPSARSLIDLLMPQPDSLQTLGKELMNHRATVPYSFGLVGLVCVSSDREAVFVTWLQRSLWEKVINVTCPSLCPNEYVPVLLMNN